jgi:hypothetical protein
VVAESQANVTAASEGESLRIASVSRDGVNQMFDNSPITAANRRLAVSPVLRLRRALDA